jgi:hypothetical protein
VFRTTTGKNTILLITLRFLPDAEHPSNSDVQYTSGPDYQENLHDPKKTHEKIAKKCLSVIGRNYFFFAAAFLTGFFASGFFAAAFFAAAMCIPPPTGKGYKTH